MSGVSTQPFAGAHVLAQPALPSLKLVEPVCERQRVGRVETVVRVSGGSGVGCVVRVPGVSTRAARSSRPGSTGLFFPKLVEPVCERQRVGRVETVVRVSGGSGVGCVVRVPGVSTRAARSSRPGSTGLFFPKLVEPVCERQRVGRVETMVRVSVGLRSRLRGGFDSAVRFAHALAEPAWEMGPSSVGDGRMST